MDPINTTLGQIDETVALVALTPSEQATWDNVASFPSSDRIIALTNCGTTDLYVAYYRYHTLASIEDQLNGEGPYVAETPPNAATVIAAYYEIIPAATHREYLVKGNEALRVVRSSGSGVVVSKIRRVNF